MSRNRYKRKFVLQPFPKIYSSIAQVWAGVHCGSKMEKQNLQAGEDL